MPRGVAIPVKIRKRMVDMYQSGMSTEQIGAYFGVTREAARANISRELGRLRISEEICPYSRDCFSCPLPDCRATNAFKYNTLPLEHEITRALGHEARWEKEKS